MEVLWVLGLLTASGRRAGETGARRRWVLVLVRWSSPGHSCLEGERGIASGPFVTPRQHAGPAGLARGLPWVHASKVDFMAFSMWWLSSGTVSSECKLSYGVCSVGLHLR